MHGGYQGQAASYGASHYGGMGNGMMNNMNGGMNNYGINPMNQMGGMQQNSMYGREMGMHGGINHNYMGNSHHMGH